MFLRKFLYLTQAGLRIDKASRLRSIPQMISAILYASASTPFTFQIKAFGNILTHSFPLFLRCAWFQRSRAPPGSIQVTVNAPHFPETHASGFPKAKPQSSAITYKLSSRFGSLPFFSSSADRSTVARYSCGVCSKRTYAKSVPGSTVLLESPSWRSPPSIRHTRAKGGSTGPCSSADETRPASPRPCCTPRSQSPQYQLLCTTHSQRPWP
mmetsp:Transcript_36160/g.56196  ORF Transcript_36160/g.56196 Transcript_36160/m.56196 type:complete len:211 (+) Transcript_36160:1430-2062(+)